MRTTILFMNEGHQSVHIPDDISFPGEVKVAIWREGNRVMMEPLSEEWVRVARTCEFVPEASVRLHGAPQGCSKSE